MEDCYWNFKSFLFLILWPLTIVLSKTLWLPTGGTVHLVCRNKERAEEAKAEIVKASNNQVKNFVHNYFVRL